MAGRALWKCNFCRSQRKKCEPTERTWPGQKCNACASRGLKCGPNRRSRAYTYHKGLQHSATSTGNPESPALVAELPSTQEEDVFIMPYPRDPDFTGRSNELEQLKTIFAKQFSNSLLNPVIVLTGMGGSGKTQLAIEFAYRAREQGFNQVIWLSMTGIKWFNQSCIDACHALKLPANPESMPQTLTLLRGWLTFESGHKCLLIVDGAESSNYLRIFTPQDTANIYTLVTSRSGIEEETTIFDHVTMLRMQVMDESEALMLLERKLPCDNSSMEDRRNLLCLLGHIPLAITQATTYILAKETTITMYREQFLLEVNSRASTFLLRKEMGDSRRGPGKSSSILFTLWEVFDELESCGNCVWLPVLAVLGGDQIPESLFQVNSHDKTSDNPSTDMKRYLELGLIRRLPGGTSQGLIDSYNISMCEVVLFCMLEWLRQDKIRFHGAYRRAVSILDEAPLGMDGSVQALRSGLLLQTIIWDDQAKSDRQIVADLVNIMGHWQFSSW